VRLAAASYLNSIKRAIKHPLATNLYQVTMHRNEIGMGSLGLWMNQVHAQE
jgi:hypothetical protein